MGIRREYRRHIMPVQYEDYDDEDDSPQKQVMKGPTSAPSLEDEEAFPDFGSGAAAPAAPAMNFSAAWGSSKAPVSMPEVVSRPKKRAPTASSDTVVETAAFGGGAPKMESAPQQYTGAGVPWSDGEWSRQGDKQAHWTAHTTSTMWEQARASCKHVKDPYVTDATYSTVPKPVAKAAPQSSSTAAPVAEAPKKQRQPDAPKKKDSEGFTEVAKKEENTDKKKKKKKEGSGAAAVGGATMFASLGDGEDGEKENDAPGPTKKNRKQQKAEKQEIKKEEEDVKVDTRPKKNKKKDKKKDEDFDFDALPADKGNKKGKKGSKKGSDPGTNMMFGLLVLRWWLLRG